MYQTIVHHEGAAALTAAVHKVGFSSSVIKLGLDIHSKLYGSPISNRPLFPSASSVVVAQYDHTLPKAARRFAPDEFVPWVESLLRAGHAVHVVYEACGFGFGLYRELVVAGAHCYVIAPRKLDEERTRIKTDEEEEGNREDGGWASKRATRRRSVSGSPATWMVTRGSWP